MTSKRAMLVRNPNKGIIEDRKVKENHSWKEIGLVLNRTKMVLFYFEWFLQLDLYIFQFHYPRFSYLAYLILISFLLIFDP